MAIWCKCVAYWLFPTGFDTAVPPAIVEEVGKKKKQPPPMPTVVLIPHSKADGDRRLKKAFDLILHATKSPADPQEPNESQEE